MTVSVGNVALYVSDLERSERFYVDVLGLEVTAYRARTMDALIGVNYPPSLGFTNSQLENVGTLENKGLELQVTGTPVRTFSALRRAACSFVN